MAHTPSKVYPKTIDSEQAVVYDCSRSDKDTKLSFVLLCNAAHGRQVFANSTRKR